MEELRTLFVENAPASLMWAGLAIGVVFGAIVFRTNFCTMGSISDMLSFGDTRRFRAWLLAIAIAMIGTQALNYTGVVDTSGSMYIGSTFTWVGHVLGGLMFGFGMVFSGGCASRNVARVGGGDLRALFTLIVMGLFAYMTIGGIFGVLRQSAQQVMAVDMSSIGQETTDLGAAAGAAFGLEQPTGGMVLALVLGLATIAICFADKRFRTSMPNVLAGVGIGLCVIAGWAATGLAFDEFADTVVQPISLTFVRPSGDTLEWMQRSTAIGLPSFGVATIFGGIVGAFLTSLAMGRFRLQTFTDTNDTLRTLFGAALMGVGGVAALGCTVGQAMTGVSTLAVGSLLTFGAIIAGAVFGVRALEYQLTKEAEAA
ncbi:MAG: YeeE/YedE family protein [Pseudomonadota bacterium]